MTVCWITSPSWKEDYSKRVDPFTEGTQNNFDGVNSPEKVFIPLIAFFIYLGPVVQNLMKLLH